MKKYIVVPVKIEKRRTSRSVLGKEVAEVSVRTIQVLVREKDLSDFKWVIEKGKKE